VSTPLSMFSALLQYVLGGVKKRHELAARVLAIEAQLSVLAARPKGLSWGGIWGEGEVHAKNTLTTRGGGLWLAERDTEQQPGAPDSGWRLIVKRGSLSND